MKTNPNSMNLVSPCIGDSNLFFSEFPAFLQWAAYKADDLMSIVETDFLHWASVYEQIFPRIGQAHVAAVLTVLAECSLAYDEDRGVITADENEWYFCIFQGLILRHMAACITDSPDTRRISL